MNRIILIGNGFDLAHGLPTRYEDFIKWYYSEWFYKLRSSNRSIETDGLCIFTLGNNSISWCHELANWAGVNQGKYFAEGIRILQDAGRCKRSSFLDEICKVVETKKWVDIENEYYKFLRSFLGNASRYANPNILNNELNSIKLKLIEYLVSIQDSWIKDLHLNNKIKREILSSFTHEDISLNPNAKKAWKDFIKKRSKLPKEGWEKLLESYGRDDISFRLNKIEAFKKNYDNKVKKRIAIKEGILEDFLLPDKIMLLNFNYTSTADAYLPEGDRFTVNHIHGELLNPESVIFGYGDELDESYKELLKLEENEYLRNIKSIRYLEANNYRNMLYFIESDFFQVCIMGHSCGNSDRTLLNTLFEHKNCVSVKPFYYKKSDGSDNYLEIVQNICRNFTDMKLMRDRVVNKARCVALF